MGRARTWAVRALIAVEEDGGYSNLVLDRLLRDAALSEEDAGLTTALFYGVLDRKRTLDWFLRPYLKRPDKKLSPTVRNALRVGAYQLLYMDRIPPFAAISESVEVVKRSRDAYAAGMTNAVLRQLQRSGAPALPQGNTAQALSVRVSCEPWLAQRLIDDCGANRAEELLTAFLERPATFLRVNRTKIEPAALIAALAEEGAAAEPVPDRPNALRLTRGSVESTQAYRQGWFHVQDLSSQRCCDAVEARPGMAVLDLCAAPGGKTFTVAENMGGKGRIVSRDLHESRVRLIREGAARLDLANVCACQGDATRFDESLGRFDRVLCDVPCSGIGVIRRKPEIKYKPAFDPRELTEIQTTILETASRYVAPGGRLIYSTCTMLKAENGDITDAFLERHPDFAPVGEPVLQWPGQGSDGFYYACMERT